MDEIRRPLLQDTDCATDDVYPVHLHDVNFRKLIMVCTMRFDHVLDAHKLHNGLARLLEMGDWRKLGGRLRYNAAKELEIHVPKVFSPERPAVTFTHDDLPSMSIAQHDLASKLPRPTEITSIQPNPYNLVELGVRKGIPGTFDEMVNRDVPQLSLHVVSFQDATLVSISWPHSAMAAQGLQSLLQAWSLVVNGQEKQVPRYLGANEDVLLELENREPQSSRQTLRLTKHRATGLRALLFVVRFLWDKLWSPALEVRSVFLPRAALARLHDACRDEMADSQPTACDSNTITSTEESVMLQAWFARLAASTTRNSKPVTLVGFLSARRCLASMLDKTGVYVQNMYYFSFSFIPGVVARGRLGPLILEHTRQVQLQSTEQQCLGFLRAYRRETEDGSDFKPLYGPCGAHIIASTSFVHLDYNGAVNFRAAVVRGPETDSGAAPAGSMTCYYYHILNNKLGSGLECIYLLGKDCRENLWVTASLPAKAWDKIGEALAEYD